MERSTILRTPRLAVTTWCWADLEELHRLHSDPVTMRYIRNGRPESRAETADLLAQYIEEQQDRGWTKWRVANHDGLLVGRAGFGTYQGERALAYTIRRDRWGEGLSTEVAESLVRWHRGREDAAGHLWAQVAVANPASARVLEKVGFVRHSQEWVLGEFCDVYRLAVPR